MFVEDGIGSRSLSYAQLSLQFNQALQRLLILDLALRKYQLTHNALPDSLDQLVPDIPRDPFDPAGEPLRYKRVGDGYILYSVSENGVDDGGIPPDEEGTVPADWIDWWQDEYGDLRLDHYFAE